jgi:hypothetical protein
MDTLDQMARVDQELEQAQRDLRDTLEQVNHKVEQVEAKFNPLALIRNNPVSLSLLAAVLGYLAGSDGRPRPFHWITLGGLLGAAFAVSRNQDGNGRAA